ncbi:MAG: mannose-1-phosphate guanylyltransferase [Bacteroidales bacterium]|nr:mannose-1-phosphate guanylyltransferase [Bacteroidales bacterium]
MDNNRFCIIMAGGIGSRFWPYSRTKKPKQFLDILGTGQTLLQRAIERYRKICPIENIFIVSNEEYGSLILEQIPDIKPDQVLLEPLRRNTAPCIAYANQRIAMINPDAVVIVAPSDHLIADEEEFSRVVREGIDFVKSRDALLTLGIMPSRPETGYGYIQVSGQHNINDIKGLGHVKTFTEKPNLDLAKIFVESGDFFWNSGIFIWTLDSITRAFEKYLPDIQSLFSDGAELYGTAEEAPFISHVYEACNKISIDYGIMEKADNVFVLCSDFGWSDLGTWGSLYDHLPHDESENGLGSGQAITFGSNRNVIHTSKNKLTVVQGLDDYIIVDTDDVLMICRKQDEQQIRQIVDEVKSRGGEKFI